MTIKEQNQKLLNDILDRNYYQFFKKNEKFLSLTFFYNNKYNNSKYIPNFELPKSNCSQIKENFIYVLDWYIQNNFSCDIKIEDEFWLYDYEFYNYIFVTLLNYIKNKNLKVKNIIIKTKVVPILNNLNILQEQILLFKKLNVNLIFSLETDLVDLGDIK